MAAAHPQRRRDELAALLAFPREDLDCELKGWLDLDDADHKDDLAKALLALANHGGGFVVLGFRNLQGIAVPDSPRPTDLAKYDQDRVQQIVDRFAEPSFQCEMHHVAHPDTGDLFPIIVVPGGHRVPIRSRSEGPNRRHTRLDTYYIRRPGPKSEAPQSGREWDELLSRCLRNNREELLETLRLVIEGRPLVTRADSDSRALDAWFDASLARFDERLQDDPVATLRHGFGHWAIAYELRGVSELTLPRLRDVLRAVVVNFTGWPVWALIDRDELSPQPYNGTLESWLASLSDSNANADFWRASVDGRLFLIRNYKEDWTENLASKSAFDVILPVQRVAECLLHARRLGEALGNSEATIAVRIDWDGLEGRRLVAWSRPGMDLRPRRPALQNHVTSRLEILASEVDRSLPELVSALLADLYAVFDLFEPPPSVIGDEIIRLQSRLP